MAEIKWYKADECTPPMGKLQRDDDGGAYVDSDYVLVWTGSNYRVAYFSLCERETVWIDHCGGAIEAVCWTPLPATPE